MWQESLLVSSLSFTMYLDRLLSRLKQAVSFGLWIVQLSAILYKIRS